MNTLTFTTAGDGLGGCAAGRSVTITGFAIDYYSDQQVSFAEYCNQVLADQQAASAVHVTVLHDSDCDVYTDSAFVEAARKFTGIEGLLFTQRDQQDIGLAAMEFRG